jgi:hypothetical protein
MAQKSYIITHDFKAPYVQITGIPHNPQAIKMKKFSKGDIIRGELKHANNKPAFILVNGVCVVPLDVVKELVTKEVVSGADGNSSKESKPKSKVISIPTNPKVRYADAIIIGAIIGAAGAYLAEKQGWISEPDKKNKLYGAGIGALAAAYIVYRTNNAKPKIQVVKTTEED